MIYFITGKPRQGKTYWCVGEIIRQLVKSDVAIVTNISLNLAEIHEYIVRHHSEVDVDVFSRVRLIDSSQVFEFWRFRSGGLVLPHFGAVKGESSQMFLARAEAYFGPLEKSPETSKGVAYFLDEVHLYFSSHRWQEIGDFVRFYASLHGHLGDAIFLISNLPSGVYKGFRELVNEWSYVQNNYERSFGPFKRRAGFVRLIYEHLPQKGSVPVDKEVFFLNDIGKCYSTRAAAGIRSVKSEVKRTKKRKLPFWTIPVGVAVLALALVVFLGHLPGWVGRYFDRFTDEAVSKNQTAPKNLVESMAADVSNVLSGGGGQSQSSDDPAYGPNPVYRDQRIWVTGIVRRGSRVLVQLSDGTVLDNTDSQLGMIAPHGVWIDGVKYPIKAGVRPPAIPHFPALDESTNSAVVPSGSGASVSDESTNLAVVPSGSGASGVFASDESNDSPLPSGRLSAGWAVPRFSAASANPRLSAGVASPRLSAGVAAIPRSGSKLFKYAADSDDE